MTTIITKEPKRNRRSKKKKKKDFWLVDFYGLSTPVGLFHVILLCQALSKDCITLISSSWSRGLDSLIPKRLKKNSKNEHLDE